LIHRFIPGVGLLSIADRSAVANMCSEYGSLIGYFPLDELTMEYLSNTGRDRQQLSCIEAYLKRVGMFRTSSKVSFGY
jgi:aconitate hydratase